MRGVLRRRDQEENAQEKTSGAEPVPDKSTTPIGTEEATWGASLAVLFLLLL